MDKNNYCISIIVPLYYGKKYIPGIIRQIEDCAVRIPDARMELVFSNDTPDEPITDTISARFISVKVLNTDQNRGIHGARVRGLQNSMGHYILFLDQDDHIKPEYFFSQLSHLGEADAVVCRLLHGGRQFYDTRMPFEQVITRDYMISVRNPIISPGQVLLRRDGIPRVWREAKLKNNGADDWLLWLCMLGEKRRFALNTELLFEHMVGGENESANVEHMIASEQEMYEVLKSERVLSGDEIRKLQNTVQTMTVEHIKLLSKFQKMFFVYNDWLAMQEQGFYIDDYLKGLGVGSIAIYGYSYIGKRLYHSQRGKGIEVRYFIDRNAEFLEADVPVYLPCASLPSVDLIVICLVDEVDDIRKRLSALSEAKISSITELLANMKEDSRETKE